jgi:hypothetical protein
MVDHIDLGIEVRYSVYRTYDDSVGIGFEFEVEFEVESEVGVGFGVGIDIDRDKGSAHSLVDLMNAENCDHGWN